MFNIKPELAGPPEIYYGIDEAKKYTQKIITIQSKMTERALELLSMSYDNQNFIIDIGYLYYYNNKIRCGSGISGEVLTEKGYNWIGIDISRSMLDVAKEREVEGDLIESDMGDGLCFKEDTFDGCISISALQWLCYSSKSDHNPIQRMYKFFSSLFKILKMGSRAIFQFYPSCPDQIELLTKYALKAGFTGGVVVDYPNSTKAKKIFLCLFTGYQIQQLPEALKGYENEEIAENLSSKYKQKFGKFKKPPKKSKQWIIEKKQKQRFKGQDVRHDSKYTGRKRKPKF